MSDVLINNVLIKQPFSRKAYVFIVLLIFIITLMFLYIVKFNDVRTVSGYVVHSKGVYRIYAQTAGKISFFSVAYGDHVNIGDDLFHIKNEGYKVHGGKALYSSVIEEMENQVVSGEHLIQTLNQMKEIEINRNYMEIAALKKKRAQTIESLHLLKQRYAIKQEFKGKLDSAKYHDAISPIEKSNIEDDLSRTKIEILSMEGELDFINSQISQLIAGEQGISAAADTRQQQVLLELSGIKKQNLLESGGQDIQVTAPIAGKISSILKNVGNDVNKNNLVLVISPDDSEFEVELLLPDDVVSHVEKGNKVFLKYRSYPYQLFGIQKGHIFEIDDQMLLTGERQGLPVNPGYAFYKAKVKLDRQNILSNQQQYALKAGMELKAEIVINEVSILQWILEPLTR